MGWEREAAAAVASQGRRLARPRVVRVERCSARSGALFTLWHFALISEQKASGSPGVFTPLFFLSPGELGRLCSIEPFSGV